MFPANEKKLAERGRLVMKGEMDPEEAASLEVEGMESRQVAGLAFRRRQEGREEEKLCPCRGEGGRGKGTGL